LGRQKVNGESHSGVIRVNKIRDAVVIELTGPYAFFPSTSNSKAIRFKRYNGAQFYKRGKLIPYIGSNSSHLAKLKEMSLMYVAGCLDAGIAPPSFHDTPVHCIALLARPKGIWDVHNATKPIGDWLQGVGVVTNDKSLEIWPVDISRYDMFTNKQISRLLIQPTESISIEVESFIQVQILKLQPNVE